jgi:hypothetical protein
MNLIQWTKLDLNHCNQLFLCFWLEYDIEHGLSGTDPKHYATQSFQMTGLRGVFKHTGIQSWYSVVYHYTTRTGTGYTESYRRWTLEVFKI